MQHSPATRVNRYIGRLIEARQTESEMSDLNYVTMFYRNGERERRVREEELRNALPPAPTHASAS